MDSKQNTFQGFSPMQVFAFGIVQGVLVLCTLGFFLLLPVVFKGGGFVATEGKVLGDQVAVAPAAPTVPTPTHNNPTVPTAISISDVDPETDHIRGNPNAKVTVVEFSDFECPFCERFHETMKQVIDTNDEVNWVYRHFPLESIHANARSAAIGSECAAEQGKFWEFADAAFENQRSLSNLSNVAQLAGLNVSAFDTCMDSGKYDSDVTADATEAQRAGGRGTPYSVIVGPDRETVALSGAQPLAAVEQAISQFLAK